MSLTRSVLYHFTYPDPSTPVLAFFADDGHEWRFLTAHPSGYVYEWLEVSEDDRRQALQEHFQHLLAVDSIPRATEC